MPSLPIEPLCTTTVLMEADHMLITSFASAIWLRHVELADTVTV